MNQQEIIKQLASSYAGTEMAETMREDGYRLGRYEGFIAGYTSSLEKGLRWVCGTKLNEVNDGSPIDEAIVRDKKTKIPYGEFMGWDNDSKLRFNNYAGVIPVNPIDAEFLDESSPSDAFTKAEVEELLRQQRELCKAVAFLPKPWAVDTLVEQSILTAPSPIK